MRDDVKTVSVPVEDVVLHENAVDCVCGPAVVPIRGGDGSRILVLTHRQLMLRPIMQPADD